MRTVEAVPSRVVGVGRFLLSCKDGREQQAKVEAMMSPSTLKNAPEDGATAPITAPGEAMIRKVIRECCAMGLCSLQDGVLSLSPEASEAFPKARFDAEKMRVLLRRLILRLQPDANRDLGLVLTWFMEQDPLTFGIGKGDRRAALMAELRAQTGEGQLQVTNNNPADNFSYWAVYLGLGWKMSLGAANTERLVPDPTPFLSRQLPDFLPLRETLPLSSFLEQLAFACPVFRGSEWHSELEQKGSLPPRESQYLPPALAFAFKRLEEQSRLKLVFRGDADSLLLRFDGQTQNLSHLERQL